MMYDILENMSARCEVSYQKIREAASRLPERVKGVVKFLRNWLTYSGDPLGLSEETKPEAPPPSPFKEPRLTNNTVVRLKLPPVSVSLKPQKVKTQTLRLPCNQEYCSRLEDATGDDLDRHPGKNQRLDICKDCPMLAPSLPSIIQTVSEIANNDMVA